MLDLQYGSALLHVTDTVDDRSRKHLPSCTMPPYTRNGYVLTRMPKDEREQCAMSTIGHR